MSVGVLRILRSIAGDVALSWGVLVIRDITSAYYVGRAKEAARPEILTISSEEFGGADFYFGPWRGETPRTFLPHEANDAWRGCFYDWALLIGGWNSYSIDGDEAGAIFADLYAYCVGDLIRKWLIYRNIECAYRFFLYTLCNLEKYAYMITTIFI